MPEPRIWILPQEVAERIAAGEVVERPASVVKELVENALDAGARRVTVETDAGGKVLIRVTDDGGGMTPDEAQIALQRHATSKLRTADDLFNIHTLGFRGEALPSIAAVSEMEILTRTPDAAEGSRLVVEGGVIRVQEPAAAQVGTTISVRKLFFNVPVREKFLRSDTAEANQITEWLQRLALSRSDVSFRLVHDGREALLSPGSQDPLNAVVCILGRPVARELIRIPEPVGVPRGRPQSAEGSEAGGAQSSVGRRQKAEGSPPETELSTPHSPTPPLPHSPTQITVTGFVGRPTLTRANRSLQHFYVNGRAVRSPLFYRALDDAYRATMPQGRYPAALLFIQVPPDAVDVNVHPAKTEVRFQDDWAVQAALSAAVQSALRTEGVFLEGSLSREQGTSPVLRVAEPGFPPAPPDAMPFADRAIGGPPPYGTQDVGPRRWRDPGAGAPHPPEHPPGAAQEGPRTRRSLDDWAAGQHREAEPPTGEEAMLDAEGRTGEAERQEAPALEDPFADEELTAVHPPAPGPARSAVRELTLLGQAQDLFILAEGDGRLWIIDQHVAHERVLFDQMTAPGAAREPSETLLIPVTLEVDRAHALALDEHLDLLADLGFGVEPFGPNRYRLQRVPRSLVGRNYEAAFRDLADELAERSHGGQVKLRKEEVALAAAGRSCKRAVKAGNRLSQAEMERLLADLRSARNPYTCPHGRPVFLTFEPDDIAALFGSRTCE
jgi:DNA mismatch repair protein MutL